MYMYSDRWSGLCMGGVNGVRKERKGKVGLVHHAADETFCTMWLCDKNLCTCLSLKSPYILVSKWAVKWHLLPCILWVRVLSTFNIIEMHSFDWAELNKWLLSGSSLKRGNFTKCGLHSSSVETQVSMGTYRPYHKTLYWHLLQCSNFHISCFCIFCAFHVFAYLAHFAILHISHFVYLYISRCPAWFRNHAWTWLLGIPLKDKVW